MRKLAALGVAAAVSLGAVPAMAEDAFIGIFQTPEGGMDYRATMCGDGTLLCVQLVDLHGAGDTDKNRKYMGAYIIKEFPQVRKNVWRGVVQIKEDRVNGDVTLTPNQELYVKACAFIVVCADIKLHYVAGADPGAKPPLYVY
ncbi:MAG: hypothetical protein ABL879_12625 [Devosia sp.]